MVKYSYLRLLRFNQSRDRFSVFFQITLKLPFFLINVLLNTDERIFHPCLPAYSDLSLPHAHLQSIFHLNKQNIGIYSPRL